MFTNRFLSQRIDYTIHSYSSYSSSYYPSHIKTDLPHDPTSRWSSASNDQKQYIILELDTPTILTTITFGKFSKIHVCNVKELKVLSSPFKSTEVGIVIPYDNTNAVIGCSKGNSENNKDLSSSNPNPNTCINNTNPNPNTCINITNPNPTPNPNTCINNTNPNPNTCINITNPNTFNTSHITIPFIEVLHTSLHNDTEKETFLLKVTNNNTFILTRYIKIVPLQAWGMNFNYSVWFVALHGIPVCNCILPLHIQYKHYQSIRLILKYLQRNVIEMGGNINESIGEGLNNSTGKQQGLNDSTGKQKGLNSSTTKQHPINISTSDQQGLNDTNTPSNNNPYTSFTSIPLQHPLLSSLYSYLNNKKFKEAEDLIKEIKDNKYFKDYINKTGYKIFWYKIPRSEPWPGSRGGHHAVIHKGVIYMYGGWNGTQELCDMWKYTIGSTDNNICGNGMSDSNMSDSNSDSSSNPLLYTRIRTPTHIPTTDPTYPWCLISTNTKAQNGPGRRSCHKMCINPLNDSIYVLGRYLPTEYQRESTWLSSDMYKYDINSDKWEIEDSGFEDVSSSSSNRGVSGGSGNNTPLNNSSNNTPLNTTHINNTHSLYNTGDRPDNIYDHQMLFYNDLTPSFFIYGGRAMLNDTQGYSGLYLYEINTRKWKCIRNDNEQPEFTPWIRGRVGHTVVYIPKGYSRCIGVECSDNTSTTNNTSTTTNTPTTSTTNNTPTTSTTNSTSTIDNTNSTSTTTNTPTTGTTNNTPTTTNTPTTSTTDNTPTTNAHDNTPTDNTPPITNPSNINTCLYNNFVEYGVVKKAVKLLLKDYDNSLVIIGGQRGKEIFKDMTFYKIETDSVYDVVDMDFIGTDDRVVVRSVLNERGEIVCLVSNWAEECMDVYVYRLEDRRWCKCVNEIEDENDRCDRNEIEDENEVCDVRQGSRYGKQNKDKQNISKGNKDRLPMARSAHVFLYDKDTDLYFLYGGNMNTENGDKRVSDMWKMKMKGMEIKKIKMKIVFLIRKYKFMCLLAESTEEALKYLRIEVCECVDHSDKEMASEFRKLCCEIYKPVRHVSVCEVIEEIGVYFNRCMCMPTESIEDFV